jgi:hypothetical protein
MAESGNRILIDCIIHFMLFKQFVLLRQQTGPPECGRRPAVFLFPRLRQSRIPAAKEWPLADNFL